MDSCRQTAAYPDYKPALSLRSETNMETILNADGNKQIGL